MGGATSGFPYIAQRLADHPELRAEDYLLEWVTEDRRGPVAVLSGYGMGKTTLARRIAALLAKAHEQDRSRPIPILIELHEFVEAPSLDALLGAGFTSRHPVRGYSFPKFMRMSEQGRFVFILDGFDEMKRGMTDDALLYCFEQLNRLHIGESKVLLLGRPSCLLDEEDLIQTIRGRRRILDRLSQIPGWPEYEEVRLAPFSRVEIARYVDQWLADGGRSRAERDGAKGFLAAVMGPKDRGDYASVVELAKRPVQLRMIVEVLPAYKGPLRSLGRTALFTEFVDLLLRREGSKQARLNIATEARRSFLQKVAYWVWHSKDPTSFEASEIPRDFYRHVEGGSSPRGILRDLLSTPLIDRKLPTGFFFPHRSFLEYLVAAQMIAFIEAPDGVVLTTRDTTPEVAGFFAELMGRNQAKKLAELIARHPDLQLSDRAKALFGTVLRAHDVKGPSYLTGKGRLHQLNVGASDHVVAEPAQDASDLADGRRKREARPIKRDPRRSY